MKKHVLITGGAGFIGSHLAIELLGRGYKVRALDNLAAQVHGPGRQRPDYLPTDVELLWGDVRDPEMLGRALEGIDAVVHLAALVGVGQSMYQIAEYTSVNTVGTGVLLEKLSRRPVEKLLVASSMSIYGEGLYRDADGAIREAAERPIEQLRAGDWEVKDNLGRNLIPQPTPESKVPVLASVYALSKFDQERLCLVLGRTYGIPVVALRLFNTYGPNQALSNPYTGALSNFASRVLNGREPLIFEDGLQQRDFVSVYDVARAFRMALESTAADGLAINISNGVAMTVREVATRTIRALGDPNLEPSITGKYRAGDIRHCFADIGLAARVLGWKPQVTLEEGLADLARWIEGQEAIDRGMEARAELAARGLMV